MNNYVNIQEKYHVNPLVSNMSKKSVESNRVYSKI